MVKSVRGDLVIGAGIRKRKEGSPESKIGGGDSALGAPVVIDYTLIERSCP